MTQIENKRYVVDDLSPAMQESIYRCMKNTSDLDFRILMRKRNHGDDLRFILDITRIYLDPERKYPFLLSQKQINWISIIDKRFSRGYYDYDNIGRMIHPPKHLADELGDLVDMSEVYKYDVDDTEKRAEKIKNS